MAKQAKALKKKLQMYGSNEEDEEDIGGGDSEENGDDGKLWGAKKSDYYKEEEVSSAEESEEDEDELMQEEETEAKTLQRKAAAALQPDDFGLDLYATHPEEEDEDQEGKGEEEEEEEEEGDDLEVRAAAVRQDSLELVGLISELKSTLEEIRGRVGPLLQEIQAEQLATKEGISYLEAKHILLIHYGACIIFYLLLKAEGRPVVDHPVIQRLIEARTYLEKIRPIDKRLQYQIQKLLNAIKKSGVEQEEGEKGELQHGPRPEALRVVEEDRQVGALQKSQEDGGIYRPPRLNPAAMESDVQERKERRRLLHEARRAERSSYLNELALELTGAPEEHRNSRHLGMETTEAKRHQRRMSAREEVEEELMTRLPLSREERKMMKAHARGGLSGKALLNDLVDDVVGLTGSEAPAGSSLFVAGKHLVSQKFGADLTIRKGQDLKSGDDLLPTKDSLSLRRAKRDAAMAKLHESMDDYDDYEKKDAVVSEDPFYEEIRQNRGSNKQRRNESYLYPDLLPPSKEVTTSGARKISTAIEKNRGLTPHRRKDLKNPRKKHRIKFGEAKVRRKGQVQEVRENAGMAYSGEGTGIKARLSKSVKF